MRQQRKRQQLQDLRHSLPLAQPRGQDIKLGMRAVQLTALRSHSSVQRDGYNEDVITR
jgi:hypothetical protein